MKRRIFIATAVGIAIANATAKAIAAPQMNDKLSIPPDFDDRMTRFMSEPKFLADDTYMGYLPVEHRVAAEKL
ncbi:MAG: hypothetical protein JF615_07480, partial [Asticcacaulis sp.]|nr:hypothetical protein [Asticcacaulis sp.]